METFDKVEAELDAKTLKQLTWKPTVTRAIAVAIVSTAVGVPGRKFWPDQVSLGFVAKEHGNCIGLAWRNLKSAGIIRHGSQFRQSDKESSGHRTIFEWELASLNRAKTFLDRNGAPAPVERQQELLAV
jgi:hypothetical protein